MAYDSEAGKLYWAPVDLIPEGHYANMADQVDAVFYGPVELAQRGARRAILALNLLPESERTDSMQAKAAALSAEAHRLASAANLELMMERGV